MHHENLTELLTVGFRQAVAKAIAEHEREGRGAMVRAAQMGAGGTFSCHKTPNGHKH